MKPLTWAQYWDGFYDWAESTKKSYVRRLTSFGPAEEVYDVLFEFVSSDEKFAARFAEMALNAGVQFTPEQAYAMEDSLPEHIVKRMEETAADPFKEKLVSWKDFYSYYNNVPVSTRIRLSHRLNSFGPPDEVCEIIRDLSYEDEAVASDFAQCASRKGVRFTPEQVLQMDGYITETTLSLLASLASKPFTRAQLTKIHGCVTDKTFDSLSKRAGIDIFENDTIPTAISAAPTYAPEPAYAPEPTYAPKLGFFESLLLAIGIAGGPNRYHSRKHPGRCTGDCAHCPPHYGYRYGRWYYGHGHVHGCEFGGNKGDGCL